MSEVDRDHAQRSDFLQTGQRIAQVEQEVSSEQLLREVFAERARLLSRPASAENLQSERNQLAFTIGDARFCAPLTHIRAVFAPECIANIPGAPAHLREVVHYDGRIVSLVDLIELLALKRSAADAVAARHVLVLEHRGALLGIRAQCIVGLVSAAQEALAQPGFAQRSEFLLGIADGMTLVLDVAALVSGLSASSGQANVQERHDS
jgi:chemotaxis signal transduction protein